MKTLHALRWWIIGLVMLGAMLNYLTRSVMGVAAPTMLAELHISERQYGWITAAFQGGIILQPIVGYVLDSVGLRYGLALFAGAWSVISMAHGFASTWPAFAVLRGLLGFAEGSANPAGMKVVATWFPARERGFAGGVYNIGASLGSMLAPPLVAWAILAYDWRAAFVITGAIGLGWATAWLLWFRTPEQHPRLSSAERELIEAGQERELAADGARPSIPSLLRRRDFWGIAIPRLLADPTWGTLSFWIPLYLVQTRGFDLKQIALFAWLPFLAADLGGVLGGYLSPFLMRRFGVRLIQSRVAGIALAAVLMIAPGCIGLAVSPYMAIALFCVGGFAHQMISVLINTLSADVFTAEEVGTANGFIGQAGWIGGLLFSLLIGQLADRIGYAPLFAALSVFDLIGAAVLILSLKHLIPAEPK